MRDFDWTIYCSSSRLTPYLLRFFSKSFPPLPSTKPQILYSRRSAECALISRGPGRRRRRRGGGVRRRGEGR